MRKIAKVKSSETNLKRLMIYESEDGVYLFGYDTESDSSSLWDEWYETLDDALESCKTEYNIENSDWQEIDDPMENCQHDRIEPVRIKGRDIGKPEWGKFEKLVDNKWIEI